MLLLADLPVVNGPKVCVLNLEEADEVFALIVNFYVVVIGILWERNIRAKKSVILSIIITWVASQ